MEMDGTPVSSITRSPRLQSWVVLTVCPYQDFGVLGRLMAARDGAKDRALLAGEVYDATANKNGAVSGITEEGIAIGVKPGEFEFVEAPEWLKKIHANVG